MVTPHQVLLFGGREGPMWEKELALLEGWLHIEAEFETAAALGALRAVTKHVLQYAAQHAMESPRQVRHETDEWLDEWRACVRAVVEAQLPAPRSAWDARPRGRTLRQQCHGAPWDTGALPVPVDIGAPDGIASQPSTSPASQHPDELPIGWAGHMDDEGRLFFEFTRTGESRWERPAASGPDGSAAAWRWTTLSDGRCCYINGSQVQWSPPEVGDAQLVPLGWDCAWDCKRKRHYFFSQQARTSTWELPAGPPEPLLREHSAQEPWPPAQVAPW